MSDPWSGNWLWLWRMGTMGKGPEELKDYAGRWSEKAIDRAKELGLMSDYADGAFRPTQALTREEAAALAVKMWNEVMEQVSGCLGQVAKRMQEIAGALGGVAGVEGEASEARRASGAEAGGAGVEAGS